LAAEPAPGGPEEGSKANRKSVVTQAQRAVLIFGLLGSAPHVRFSQTVSGPQLYVKPFFAPDR
jgi:hypothetical protein